MVPRHLTAFCMRDPDKARSTQLLRALRNLAFPESENVVLRIRESPSVSSLVEVVVTKRRYKGLPLRVKSRPITKGKRSLSLSLSLPLSHPLSLSPRHDFSSFVVLNISSVKLLIGRPRRAFLKQWRIVNFKDS